MLEVLAAKRGTPAYHAMYSSWWDGIVVDPSLMVIAVDDHLVHRGDGVFEAFKFQDGAIYDLWAHLDRLETSAKAIYMELPFAKEVIAERIIEVVKAAKQSESTLRLYISRGPGGFDANPYESVGLSLIHI